jgi:hypothetical protein
MTIEYINSNQSIGNTVSSLNLNFQNLNDAFINLIKKTEDYLMPFVNFIKDNQSEVVFLYDILNDKKPIWDQMSTLVFKNSSNWMKPLVFLEPKIYNEQQTTYDNIKAELVEKFKTLYPMFNQNDQPIYIDNQLGMIYFYVNHTSRIIQTEDIVNSDYAECISEGIKTTVMRCNNRVLENETSCGGSIISCNGCAGNTCQEDVVVSCNYPDNNSNRTLRYIQSKINYKLNDIAEKTIGVIFLRVKNCSWEFEKIQIGDVYLKT